MIIVAFNLLCLKEVGNDLGQFVSKLSSAGLLT